MGKLREIATGHQWEKIPNDARIAMLAADDEINRLREVLSTMCWQFDENMNNEDCGPFFDARQDARDLLNKP